VYSAALEERIGAWRWQRRTVTRFQRGGVGRPHRPIRFRGAKRGIRGIPKTLAVRRARRFELRRRDHDCAEPLGSRADRRR
jgi:hypothetical protein